MDATGAPSPSALYSAPANWTITWASFSPDGQSVAFVEQGPGPEFHSRIKIVDTDPSTNDTPIVVMHEGNVYSPRFLEWSPASNELAFSSPLASLGTGEHIFIINLDVVPTGPQPLPISGSAARPSWCGPTGKELAFEGTAGVSIYDRTTRKIRIVARGARAPKCRKDPTPAP
jgi:Tol biopolymer transport system component